MRPFYSTYGKLNDVNGRLKHCVRTHNIPLLQKYHMALAPFHCKKGRQPNKTGIKTSNFERPTLQPLQRQNVGTTDIDSVLITNTEWLASLLRLLLFIHPLETHPEQHLTTQSRIKRLRSAVLDNEGFIPWYVGDSQSAIIKG